MSQDYTADCYAAGHVGQTDLSNMEKNHECHRSSFSGLTGPANPLAGQDWYDTTKKIRRFRDYGNANWLCLLPGDANQKIWIYRNDTVEGMVVDSSLTDRVIAIKGGSQAYDVNGGNVAGTWTQEQHAHAGPNHNHKWYLDKGDAATAKTYNSAGSEINVSRGNYSSGNYIPCNNGATGTERLKGAGALDPLYTEKAGTGSTGQGGTPNTWRPAAAVGTLQRPDI
jgi:hypothetical protein